MPKMLLAVLLLVAFPVHANPFASAGEPVTIAQGYDFPSRTLGEARRINVMLPPGYGRDKTRYPVLYLLDGGAEQDLFHIAGLVHQHSLWGLIRPMIVVGVESDDRANEFTSRAADPELAAEMPTNGGSDRFRTFLTSELRPAVEAVYRTDGTASLIGESLAGLFIVETALRNGGFDHYIAVSPSLWWDKLALPRNASSLLRKRGRKPASLWLALGDEGPEMAAGMEGLVTALRTEAPESLSWRYVPFPEEQHSTIFHPAAMKAIRTLFAAPPEPEGN